MDVEYMLTRMADQFGPANLQIAKDHEGPLFVSRETDNMFILTAKLPGYKRGNIKIDINKSRNRIGITGERPVQETMIVGIRVYTKDIVIKRLQKFFKIPDRVIHDQINAKFNDLDSVLTITMPKTFKGIHGYRIEEVNDQEIGKEGLETLQIADDESTEQIVLENAKGKGNISEGYELDKPSNSKPMANHSFRKDDDRRYGMYEGGAGETRKGDSEKKEGADEPGGKSLICAPVVAGSALLISLVVFVFHMIRNKDQSKKRD